MKWIQYLIFEISSSCNMAPIHSPTCPIWDPGRYANQPHDLPMSTAEIVNAIICMYEIFDFKGIVGFHFYNEPTLEWDRMMRIIGLTKQLVQKARFGLLTNGTLLRADIGLCKFSQLKVTNYLKRDWSWLRNFVEDVQIIPEEFDRRANPGPDPQDGACGRIFNEMIFDFYGNAHPCCMDWRGELRLGNLHSDSLESIISNFQKLRESIYPMSTNAPEKCRQCFGRFDGAIANIVPGLCSDIAREVAIWRPSS